MVRSAPHAAALRSALVASFVIAGPVTPAQPPANDGGEEARQTEPKSDRDGAQ